jgi:NifU-like protein involved in Fe-S cluster formation
MSNPLGYPETVWQLFRETPRAGQLGSGALCAEASTPAAPFRLRMEIRLQQGQVADTRFQTYGCPYTIAVGAWLAEWLIGRGPEDLATPPIAELRTALEIPDERAHCCLMAQDVLRDLHRQLS